MIPLEAALDQQNHPEKYAQLAQEKLEKEIAQSGATVEREKWLKHPCTVKLLHDLYKRREELIENAERSANPVFPFETIVIRKISVCVTHGVYPTELL